MKEFDIDKIGKKMPYKAPSEEFFKNFQAELIEKVAAPEPAAKKRLFKIPSMRLFVPILAAAASLLIGVFVADNIDYKAPTTEMGYLISDNLDASMDSYFNSLSDDELAYLFDNTSSQDDFYVTLQTNE